MIRSQQLERFFAREVRRSLTGSLPAGERPIIRLPVKGPIKLQHALQLGLARTDAPLADPRRVHWAPQIPLAELHQPSPFMPRVGSAPTPAREWKRIWSTAHAQGLDHLLPVAPAGRTARQTALAEARTRSVAEEASLLDLASELWHGAGARQALRPLAPGAMAAAVREYTAGRGPYAGRSGRPFKLKKHVRERPSKAREVATKLAAMPGRVADHRAELAKARTTRRHKHPY